MQDTLNLKMKWARPAQIKKVFGIPRGSLYRILNDNPDIRTGNLRGPGSARVVNVADMEDFINARIQPFSAS